MADIFKNYGAGLESPARYAAAVTPDDGADLATATRSLYVGGAGDVAVEMVGGGAVTLVGAEGVIPVCVKRVLATGTTATSIVALW